MKNEFTIEVSDDYLYGLYKARNTLWHFNNFIIKGFTGYNAIKFKNENDIFVWLENIIIKDGYYEGILADCSEKRSVHMDEAIDWMIVENFRMIGGYTVRHYVHTLDDEEKLNFEIYCGYRIDHGNDFFKADCSTAEGAIIELENYYNEKDLNGILSCKDFPREAENILIENNISVEAGTVKKIAAVLKLSLMEDLEKNGFPNFTGIERVFTLKDERENLQLIEEQVIYHDGFVAVNNMWVGNFNGEGWKVLNRID